jgi:DNA-directed RNA polymerase subunit RPC12/RpoP
MADECSIEVSPGNHTTAEFVCEDCGDQVHKFGDHDGVSVCATCRFIREHPDMSERYKAILRGDD